MGGSGQLFCLDWFGAFCLDFAKGQSCLPFVVQAEGVNYDPDLFAPLQQSQSHCFNSTFETGANQDKLAGLHLSEQSFNSRFLEGVNAPLMQDNLSVTPKYIKRQIGVAVGREAYMVVEQRIVYLFLSLSTIDAVIGCAAAVTVVIVWVHLTGGDYGDVITSGPCHHPPDIGQDPPVIADAYIAIGEKEILLSVDVNEDLPATPFEQLPNHLHVLLHGFSAVRL